MSLENLTIEGYLNALRKLPPDLWSVTVVDGAIHLKRSDDPFIFSPITAVYFCHTGEKLHRGSFAHPEIVQFFHMKWYEMEEIRYAEVKLDCGGCAHNRQLRKKILFTLRHLSPRVALVERVKPSPVRILFSKMPNPTLTAVCA